MSLCPESQQVRSRFVRWLFAATGVTCVGVGAVGVVVPGLPTTIFLIAAAWCFTRSCPWLEHRLIRENRLFRPFLKYMEPGTPMPLRARLTTLGIMWLAVSISCLIITRGEQSRIVLIAAIIAAAIVGSWFIMRFGTRARARS